MGDRQSRRIKIVLLASSLAVLLMMLIALARETFTGEWRDHQKTYRSMLIERAGSDKARAAAEEMEISLKQIVLPELSRMDRCVTCHVGIEDPAMADAEPPLRAHSGTFLADHPPDRFGCTSCHDGQGRAIEKRAAHGEVAHWPSPRLRAKSVYTSCGRCHYENDLFGGEADLYYARGIAFKPLERGELLSVVPGSESIAMGKRLLLESGCLGCHKYRGRGGVTGPDITFVGDKSTHDFDFAHIEGEHTVANWLFEHFKRPADVSPGTLMPNMDYADGEARDLTEYLLSLHRKTVPTAYMPLPPERDGRPAEGRDLFGMFCSGCHGKWGQGSTVRDPLLALVVDAPAELMVPSLNNPDTLAVASDDYMRSMIQKGRPGTNMIAWGISGGGSGTSKAGGGLWSEEIERLVTYIRLWEPPLPDDGAIAASRGDARMGRSLYTFNCATCHGARGEGGIGVTLNGPSILGVASDEFLARVIVDGRPNTAMPSWRQFDSLQISDLIACLRSWHPRRNDMRTALALASHPGDTADVSIGIARTIYMANCTMCHGRSGEGDLGPSLSTQEFLTIAGDDYLYETIASGRPGTGMPAWRSLSNEDAASLIKLIRSWQRLPGRVLPERFVRGDWDAGGLLFRKMCASCHGTDAEGGVGPQLNNPVFLGTASDAMLKEWISYGKTGTPMRPSLKGEQGSVELAEDQIGDIVSYLRSLERRPRVSVMRSPFGLPDLGRLWYAMACASCHGDRGEGASGPALANPALLRSASDGFFMATLALGRDGTEMRPLKKSPQAIVSLSSDEIHDVVAYLRSWEIEPPSTEIPHRFVIPWDLEQGRRLYEANCSGCHGLKGRPEMKEQRVSAWAPELNNEGFLTSATDGFLQATIVRGRTGTAMRPFGGGSQGLVDLPAEDIDDIVAYIRQWSKEAASPMTLPAERSLMAAGVTR